MSETSPSTRLDAMVRRGGVVGEYHGVPVIRHHGRPAEEYRAAVTGVAVFDRGHRGRLTVSGRAPLQMLTGLLTGTIPQPPSANGDGPWTGTATYHAVLTPKGKMITDLWALLPGEEATPGVVLDVPAAGREPLTLHLKRSLPPRFAGVEDVSAVTGMITLVGPMAGAEVAGSVLDGRVGADRLGSAPEGAWWRLGEAASGLTVVRTADVWPEAYSVLGPSDAVAALWLRLVDGGVTPSGLGVWSTLRVEAGRPAFGTDMNEDTIPIEAGIAERAIDHRKGCYTGQEVIVRIRDRGHVNRRLRRLHLGDVPVPAHGTELLAPDGSGKVVGHVTSAVESPREGGVLALAYVRRGVDDVLLEGRPVRVPTE